MLTACFQHWQLFVSAPLAHPCVKPGMQHLDAVDAGKQHRFRKV